MDGCDNTLGRKYFNVYENSYESNHPMACWCVCFTLPPNSCCPGFDYIRRSYFDRGIYDVQSMAHCLGCVKGEPSIHPNHIPYMCCCIEVNCDWLKPWPTGECCGVCPISDYVSVVPYETYCCCCPNRANCCTNSCGICGSKTGSPLIMYQIVGWLKKGDGDKLAGALNNTRAEWKQRTGK